MKMKFRQDINAFRAIAVLGVVLFHFNPAWLPGGFAGVDIFFVISGYLTMFRNTLPLLHKNLHSIRSYGFIF